MSMSKELFLSILSMDAYNRGYDPGILLSGNKIGSATIGTDSQEVFRDPNTTPTDLAPDQAAGFYALSYEIGADGQIDGLSAGDVVISYRGADNIDLFGLEDGASDVWSGWTTGAGLQGSQSQLALGITVT